jgi:hypothetical protein
MTCAGKPGYREKGYGEKLPLSYKWKDKVPFHGGEETLSFP